MQNQEHKNAIVKQTYQRGRAEARYEVINTHGQASSLKAGTYVDMRTPASGC